MDGLGMMLKSMGVDLDEVKKNAVAFMNQIQAGVASIDARLQKIEATQAAIDARLQKIEATQADILKSLVKDAENGNGGNGHRIGTGTGG